MEHTKLAAQRFKIDVLLDNEIAVEIHHVEVAKFLADSLRSGLFLDLAARARGGGRLGQALHRGFPSWGGWPTTWGKRGWHGVLHRPERS